MFVELVYDKRNVEGLQGAREIILAELTKRVHQIFPDTEVRVKPMQANALNSDASKSDREKLNRMLEEMFEESDMWLVSEFPTLARLYCIMVQAASFNIHWRPALCLTTAYRKYRKIKK